AASVHLRGMVANFRPMRPGTWLRLGALRKRLTARTGRAPEFGVNLVGYVHSETGVGQSARASFEALKASGVPASLHAVDSSTHTGAYSTNLFHVNADQTAAARRSTDDSLHRYRHNIGFWAWELEEFP